MNLFFRIATGAIANRIVVAIAIPFIATESLQAAVGDQLFKLTASDASPHDYYGGSVAASGNLIVVGAPQDNNPNTATGSAYVYDTSAGHSIAKLVTPGSGRGEYLGTSVAISNDVAILGAWLDTSGGATTGAAYLFNAGTGSRLFKLSPSDGAEFDQFGRSVGISGNRAIVGAPSHHPSVLDDGAAYVFDVATGQQSFEISNPSPGDGDQFGYSVAISGNIAVVGAPTHDGAGTNSGAAYVFNVTTGQRLFSLAPSDAAALDAFGNSVAIDGNVAIVGAYLKNGADSHSGAAYLFDVTTGQELHKLTASDGAAEDYFGNSVSINGNIAVVSDYRDLFFGVAGSPESRAGSAYAFNVTSGEQIAEFSGSDTMVGDRFGNAAAAGPGVAVIGAPGAGREAGAVFVFSTVPEPKSILTFVLGVASGWPLLRRKRVPHVCA